MLRGRLTCWQTMLAFHIRAITRLDTHNKINSTRFPRLTFKIAPAKSPAWLAISSVASVRKADSGTVATALVTKTTIGSASARYVARPSGAKTSRMYFHQVHKTYLPRNQSAVEISAMLLRFVWSESAGGGGGGSSSASESKEHLETRGVASSMALAAGGRWNRFRNGWKMPA